jgi:DtxR family transcriptional regulator, Mn-dependent transcriptional regulator
MVTSPTSHAAQDYLKALYLLESQGEAAVTISALSAKLEVRPASASAMIARLADEELVDHQRYGGVRLTDEGRRRALAVVRRHRLLETLLVEELGMGWGEVHAEAEALEHAVSDHLLEHIAAKLGDPAHDPHGDPIPSAQFELADDATQVLDELPTGARGRLVRVLDADPELLAYLDSQGIALGDELEVLEAEPFGGSLRIRINNREHRLGSVVTRALSIEEVTT